MSKINEQFNHLVAKLTLEEFWIWVIGWIDLDIISNIYRNWDSDTKEEEIKILKQIIKQRKWRSKNNDKKSE